MGLKETKNLIKEDIVSLARSIGNIKSKLDNTSYLLTSLKADFDMIIKVCKGMKITVNDLRELVTKNKLEFLEGMISTINGIEVLAERWKEKNNEKNRTEVKDYFVTQVEIHIENLRTSFGKI